MAEEQKEPKFVNPFSEGVTYEKFLKAVGSKSVAEYCKGKITPEELEWLENDLKNLKK